ncbi:MAG: hypothetical protein ACK4UN_13780, partial [Limisphaerales bacterium]
MTLQDFEKVRTGIVQQTFGGDFADPLQYGIHRGRFEQAKLQKLIDLGKNVRSKTVQAKIVRWKRQVQRIDEKVERLKKLKADIEASRVKVAM